MKRRHFLKILMVTLALILGNNAVLICNDAKRVEIYKSGGNHGNGQNRDSDELYELYYSNNILEIVSFCTKTSEIFLCSSTGTVVATITITGEGLFTMQVPRGYDHLYIMIISTDIYYGEL